MNAYAAKSTVVLAAMYAGLLLSGVFSGASADMQTGVQAVKRGDYPTAFREFLPEAEAGNPDAQALVANMYRAARGVSRDYAKATHWYQLAADQGHASAQYNLGVHLREGLGVEADDEQATQWFVKAAKGGFAPAMINLGVRYAAGRTLPKDPVLGYAWLQKAAGQGSAIARQKRDRIGKSMTPEQIKKAKRLSYSLY